MMAAAFLYCVVFALLAQMSNSSFIGHITCDNILTFYADGVRIVPPADPRGSDTNWKVASRVVIPASTKVYAIRCRDYGYVGGIVAAFANGIVTDGSWKCTTKFYSGWFDKGFNDNRWPRANVIGSYGTTSPWYSRSTMPRSGVSSTAKWIWTRGWRGTDKIVYCRKTDHRMITGKITCDNILTFYADGVRKVPPANPSGSDSNWRVASKVRIPTTTKVYAIKCVDRGSVGGIVASFGNGVVTDRSWRCTTRYYRGWYNTWFNDSRWPAAYVIGTYGTKAPWYDVPKVGTSYGAKWIWTRGWHFTDKTVYCRKVWH